MKKLLICALLLSTMALSIAYALNPQPEPPLPMQRPGYVKLPPVIAQQPRLPVMTGKFVISPIADLKVSIGNRQPTKVMSGEAPSAQPASGIRQLRIAPPALLGNPYAQGKGLVLDPAHPKDAATGSTLSVANVRWNDGLLKQIIANDPEAVLLVTTPSSGPSHFLESYFMKLPPGLHTYLLTVGTTADPNDLTVVINSSTLTGNQLIPNPATHEFRVLFTYDDSANSYHYLYVNVYFSFDQPQGYSGLEYFHHLQLAQVD